MRWFTLWFLTLAVLTVYLPLRADNPSAMEPRPSVFDAADKNNDGKIDRGEFQRRTTEIFYFLDVDKDGNLSFSELKGVDPVVFKGADRDGDGMLNLYEFLNSRFRDFDDADRDHDGTLTPEEVGKR